jgi:hydrogenase nickel incorporation protein HypB
MEIKIVRNVLEENTNLAQQIRAGLRSRRQSMFNFMSSPGSGKTTLLLKLIPLLREKGLRCGVIEGDITTTYDSERLQPLGIPIAQINTEFFGGDCHLAANVVEGALKTLIGGGDQPLDLILIENVGNLVCPAEFDTGSDANLVLLSVTEGEDKPLKYPLMFRKTQLAVISKIDIAQAVEANLPAIHRNIRKINPQIELLEASAKTGKGMDTLADWVFRRHQAVLGKGGT